MPYSIKSIRNVVDYINIVYQEISWYGKDAPLGLKDRLITLQKEGLIDEIIYFEPDLKQQPGANETNKMNIGLEAARKNGCTHFMTLDVDEFFDEKEFLNAKKIIYETGITHSVCNQIMYITENIRVVDCADWFPSFIYRIDNNEKFVRNSIAGIPWLIDPSKEIPITKNSKICFMNSVKMHHFTLLRKNISTKYNNSSALQSEDQQNKFIENAQNTYENIEKKIQEGVYVRVQNQFDIKI